MIRPILCYILILLTIETCAQKASLFFDVTSSVYVPFFQNKNELNVGVENDKFLINRISVGLGIEDRINFNIKAQVVLLKNLRLKGNPIITSQLKFGNYRPYNLLEPNPGSSVLFNKNSAILLIGYQYSISSKRKIAIQLQTGISYNWNKVYHSGRAFFPTIYNDRNFNSITTLSILKIM